MDYYDYELDVSQGLGFIPTTLLHRPKVCLCMSGLLRRRRRTVAILDVLGYAGRPDLDATRARHIAAHLRPTKCIQCRPRSVWVVSYKATNDLPSLDEETKSVFDKEKIQMVMVTDDLDTIHFHPPLSEADIEWFIDRDDDDDDEVKALHEFIERVTGTRRAAPPPPQKIEEKNNKKSKRRRRRRGGRGRHRRKKHEKPEPEPEPEPETDECCCCLDKLASIEFACGHTVYCPACAEMLLVCPFCRADLKK